MSDPISPPPLFTRHPGGFYLARTAIVTGDVTIGERSSLWFGAVVRGDVAPITLGARVNVQDNAVVHCDSGFANQIEDDVVIGHGAIVHGQFVGRESLIGMHATVLGRTRIGRECLIAAGALVPPGMQAPDGSLIAGIPGKIVRQVTDKDLEYMRFLAGHYVDLAEKHLRGEIRQV